MNDLLNKYFSDPRTSGDYAESNIFHSPAQIAVISSVERSLGIRFPQDYVDFLLMTNGYDGKLGESYSVFAQIEQIEEYSSNYGGQAFPWAIYIGTDGGNEMYIIDTRSPKYNFGLLPYIGEESDFINLGSTFEEFVRHLYYNDFWPTKNIT